MVKISDLALLGLLLTIFVFAVVFYFAATRDISEIDYLEGVK